MSRSLSPLASLALALLPGVAAASLLTQEDFNYAPGTLLTATGNWAAHSGAGTNAIATTNGGLTYAGYPGSGVGNAASMTTNGEDDHTTAVFSVNSGSAYVAFLVNVSATQTNGDHFLHFYQSTTSFFGRVYAKTAGADVNFGVARGAGTPNYSATAFAKGAVHLVVVKYTFVAGTQNDLADLWVDPVIGTSEPAPLISATDLTSTDATSFIGVALRQGSTTAAPTQVVDGIRVGTTWSEVVAGIVPGACCAPDGSCTITTEAGCTGLWQGPFSSCEPNPCSPVLGACCAPDGSCSQTPQSTCLAPNSWHGEWTSCDPNPCPQPTGACCLADGACQVTTEAGCTGSWLGANTTCSPYPCPPQLVTLCQIQEDDTLGVPVRAARKVEAHGIAISNAGTWSPTIHEFQITDGDCCVTVFGDTLTPLVQIGDEVQVVGTVTNFNGKVELTSPAVLVLSQGNTLPDPALVTTAELALHGEQYESCLLKVHCVNIVGGDPWPADGQNANITIDDGSGPVTMRIDKDTDIDGSAVPTAAFDAVGTVDQFDTTSPFTEGYQLKPRGLADLTLDCTVTGAAEAGVLPTVVTSSTPWPSPSRGAISFKLALPRGAKTWLRSWTRAAGWSIASLGRPHRGRAHAEQDGARQGGTRVSAGVYFLRVRAGEVTRSTSFLVLR
ncbi:MAG: hypothetical protein U0527_06235 [Candidatus Eisenbacteria bacterium]